VRFPWQRKAVKKAKPAPASSRSGQTPVKFLPQLEALEQRQMPSATVIPVFNTQDIGGMPSGGTLTTLRQAINEANTSANPDGYIIQLKSSTPYQITLQNSGGISEDKNKSGSFDINATVPVTIEGVVSGGAVVEGFSGGVEHDRVFEVLSDGPKAPVTFKNLTIEGGYASSSSGGNGDGGGLETGYSSIVKLTNVIVQNNKADRDGAGIAAGYASNGGSPGSLTLTNSFVQNNSGGLQSGGFNTTFGGGIAASTQVLTLDKTQVTGNTLGFSGGNNVGLGGGVALRDDGFQGSGGNDLVMDNSTISSNTAFGINSGSGGGEGGGIYAEAGGIVTISNSTIGGASASDGNIAGGSESGGGSGGGIFFSETGRSAVKPDQVSSNNGTLIITNSLIANNSAGASLSGGSQGGSGGGIYAIGSNTTTPDVQINGSTITENTAFGVSVSGGDDGGDGGGIVLSGVNAQLSGGSVSDNIAGGSSNFFGGHGGGIFQDSRDSSTLSISGKAAITGNQATGSPFVGGEGGGIYLSGFSGGRNTLNVDSSTISSNRAEGGGIDTGGWGGGIASNGGIVHLTNATIGGKTLADGNTAESIPSGGTGIGGGLFVFGLPSVSGGAFLFSVTNSTISNNTAGSSSTSGGQTSGEGGGIALGNIGSSAISGSTIDHNFALGNASGGAMGGGIFTGVFGGDTNLSITNSTISNNVASKGASFGAAGGGLFANASDFIFLLNDTIAYNQASSGGGGGVDRASSSGGAVFVVNTLIATNMDSSSHVGNDVAGTFNSLGHNLVGAVASGGSNGFTGPGDLVGSSGSPLDPKLGQLANHGGPTQTIALKAHSPALAGGAANTTLSSDITATTTSIPVASAIALTTEFGEIIQIGDEKMMVTAINFGTNTLTVVRGVDGTAKAKHKSGAGVNFPFDQRGPGFPRVSQGKIDIGAYEFQRPTPTSEPSSGGGVSITDQ